MDWKLTKNYTIIFLIILNIFLFCINTLSDNKYKITKSQENDIKKYSEKNNIKVCVDIPNKFYPMSQINMRKLRYDELTLQSIFFGDIQNIIRTEKFENTIFKRDKKTLILNNMYIYYEDLDSISNFDYSKYNCHNVAETIKKSLEREYGKMQLDIIVEENEYFIISYIQKMNRYKVFNNTLYIKIYKDGTKEVYFNNYQKIEIISNKIDICSADEAIYTFSKEIKNLITDKDIYIRQIDIGYYSKDNIQNMFYKFTPYYRFYIKGSLSPFYVNAYTNIFEYEVNNILVLQ